MFINIGEEDTKKALSSLQRYFMDSSWFLLNPIQNRKKQGCLRAMLSSSANLDHSAKLSKCNPIQQIKSYSKLVPSGRNPMFTGKMHHVANLINIKNTKFTHTHTLNWTKQQNSDWGSSVSPRLLLARLESAYSLIWGPLKICGQDLGAFMI